VVKNKKFVFKFIAIIGLGLLFANFFIGHVEYRLLGLENKHDEIQISQTLQKLRYSENEYDAEVLQNDALDAMSKSNLQYINGLMAIAAQKEEKQQNQDAIAIYEQIIENNKNFAPAYINYASLLYEIGQSKEAIKKLEYAIKLQPKNFLALEALGALQEQFGDLKSAKKSYERAIYLNPYSEGSLRGLAKIEAREKGIAM
jgi:tetratricopeptide (TPR) repeat protein